MHIGEAFKYEAAALTGKLIGTGIWAGAIQFGLTALSKHYGWNLPPSAVQSISHVYFTTFAGLDILRSGWNFAKNVGASEALAGVGLNATPKAGYVRSDGYYGSRLATHDVLNPR